MKKLLLYLFSTLLLSTLAAATALYYISSDLPQIVRVEDYHPLLVTEAFDRNGEKIGEFFREKRTLVPFKEIPPLIIDAFLAAEDSQFYEHGGINYRAIFRAVLTNLKAGRTVQGGSTITQQTAKTLMLSPEKTFLRKIKEAILAQRMEIHLSKEDILYLYLNQIYFGQGAYGIQEAAKTYFRKNIKDLTLGEVALIAGLPKAPSRYSPVRNPKRAKQRQVYVLNRMMITKVISKEDAQREIQTPLDIYVRENFQKTAPFYLETIRQILVDQLGESQVLDKGLRIYTSLDKEKQLTAQKEVQLGLRHLDKRQGYRGAQQNIKDPLKHEEFLMEERKKLIRLFTPKRTLLPDGTIFQPPLLDRASVPPPPLIPPYIKEEQIITGIVEKIDDEWGLVSVLIPEGQGLIDFETMKWARKPNPHIRFNQDEISKPSEALNVGDVIKVRVMNETFHSSKINTRLVDNERPEELPDFSQSIHLELEQDPLVEGALISFDQKSEDILAMVGGYDFNRSQFNRTIQAVRQTGSSFKSLVYASALDKGYTPASSIVDAPIVHSNPVEEGQEGEALVKKWKPLNHSKSFSGDVLFRNAIIRSKNVPTIKVTDDVGVDWVAHYARRLGIFNPLNMDLTIGLGTSGVTLYEMTKVFSHFGRMGKRIRPVLIHKVESFNGTEISGPISLDTRFKKEILELDEFYENRREQYLKNKPFFENNAEDGSLELMPFNVADTDDPDEPTDSTDSTGSTSQLDIEELKKLPPLFFEDPDQLIKPSTAYLITSLLYGSIFERGGTGGRARSVGRVIAGKTGSTSNYYDAWFIGYSPQIATGVWVGFDDEKTLGKSEVGGRSALPIWIEYMKGAHGDLPDTPFPVPEGIVFANIDNDTGKLASAKTKTFVRQAFFEGSEPKANDPDLPSIEDEEENSFYKKNL